MTKNYRPGYVHSNVCHHSHRLNHNAFRTDDAGDRQTTDATL